MFKSVSVRNFRILDELKVDNLKRINLIGGKNNSGKSAFLEALFLLTGATNPTFRNLARFRGIHDIEAVGNLDAVRSLVWDPLFLGFDTRRTIEITGITPEDEEHRLGITVSTEQLREVSFRNGTRRLEPTEAFSSSKGPQVLRISFTAGGLFSGDFFYSLDEAGFRSLEPRPTIKQVFRSVYVHPRAEAGLRQEAEQLGELEISGAGDKERLVSALKLFEPRLRDLSVIVRAGLPMIHGHLTDSQIPVPLALMGDGVGRLTTMLLSILQVRGGIALIDEIENGLHHSVLVDIWRVLGDVAKRYGVQIVATTHSLECIRAAYEALSTAGDSLLGLFRFDVIDGRPRSVGYDREALDAAVKSEIEVR